MSHNIETFAFTGETPWHGLGKRVEGLMTAKEAMEAGGLNWEVALQPIFVNGSLNLDGGYEQVEAKGYKGVVRQSDFATLGVVGGKYVPIQNAESFEWFDAVVAGGKARYETVGAINGGRRVFAAAKLDKEVRVSASKVMGDSILPYIMLTNTHDGTGVHEALFTGIRPVCQNTVRMALKGAKHSVKIRHTKSATDKMKQAIEVAKRAEEYFDAVQETSNLLASTAFSKQQMVALTEVLFPASEEVSTRTENNRETLLNLFGGGRGTFGETAWDAYNAVTEYVTHERGTRVSEGKSADEQRFTANYFGSGANFMDKGLDTILTMVQKAA